MAKFVLEEREPEWLELTISGRCFNIPLATDMTMDEAKCMDTIDGAIAFFNKYIAEDIAASLTLGNYRDIIVAWREASEAAQGAGASPGES